MSGEGFLSRWAKRKQEATRGDGEEITVGEAMVGVPIEQVHDASPSPIVEAVEPVDPDSITPEELAALPPVEEIVNPADFSQYLRKGVPQILRNAAMRRMWVLDPAIRDYVDPALDYAYDWNTPGGVPGNGPLVEGFDAKAAAEKFFSHRRGKISTATGEFEEAEAEALAQTVSEQANTDLELQDSPINNAERELNAAELIEVNSSNNQSDTSYPHSTLVVDGSLEGSPERDESVAVQGPKRRHGRALPV